jgi:hypothetical protein
VTSQLDLRQSELGLQQNINQVRVDVQNAVIALQQARARYAAAVKARDLQQQTLEADQKDWPWERPPLTRSCWISKTSRAPKARRCKRWPATATPASDSIRLWAGRWKPTTFPSMKRWPGPLPGRRNCRPRCRRTCSHDGAQIPLADARVQKNRAAVPCAARSLAAEEPTIEPVRPSAPSPCGPTCRPYIPPVRLANSGRLANLVRAGMLYLTVQDAIALALENNIDLEVARYNPILAEWQLERSQAGGALPGVPSSAAQAGNVANGQGVAGSQAAAGVSTGGNGNGGPSATNATIAQIGPISQTLDPHHPGKHRVQPSDRAPSQCHADVLPVLISNTRNSSFTYQQGFVIGGNVTVSYRDSYLNENAPTDVLNPSSAPSLTITFQQNLLRGFGIAVNARTIRVSQLNVKASALNFKTQVSNTVNQVLNLYYALVGWHEDIKAKSNAVEVAQQFYKTAGSKNGPGTLARWMSQPPSRSSPAPNTTW